MTEIKAGDWVKVEVRDSYGPPGRGAYQVSGTAHESVGATFVGSSPLIDGNGELYPSVTILEHKPKRMEEPGVGGVVYADDLDLDDVLWVRVRGIGHCSWVAPQYGRWAEWRELHNPRPAEVKPVS